MSLTKTPLSYYYLSEIKCNEIILRDRWRMPDRTKRNSIAEAEKKHQ